MIITANWKMNKTVVETAYFCESIREYEKHFNGVEVVICPPHTAISAMFTLLQGSVIKIGAQNMHWEWNGAYTGEIA
ncbi:MAG TPA: triose-phosphate isomerase, partial [Candidatus Limnocylindrales bacterium]|nr:triose-phosphate isomerase [Candidatus Limnocylindrales bacterium]